MTKVIAKVITQLMKKTLSNTTFRAITLSFIFLVSGIGASVLIPASAATQSAPNSMVGAATPVSQAEANWQFPNGNAFNQDYNPQHQINASVAQYLGLSWLYPLPAIPSTLLPLAAGLGAPGVGMQILVVNGTAYAITNFDQVLAFNVANGNVLWTVASPLSVNETAPSGAGGICFGVCAGFVTMHHHDGNEWFTTAKMGPTINGPTLWWQGDDRRIFAVNALTGKLVLNFSTYTGKTMVPGNSPSCTYHSVGPSNVVVDQKRGILIAGIDAEISADNCRGFFTGWNLNVNPPKLAWVTFTTPPQPNSNLPLDPNWTVKFVNNLTQGAGIFWAGKGSSNDYVTPTELQGGVQMNGPNDNVVVNLKTMSPSQLNATLYNDWGQVGQSAQCQQIDGGGSTGSTGSGWGGPWVMGSGPTDGMAFVGTNNKDPFVGPCNPGPDLWSASILALNDTTGKWIWAFQTTPHDIWDWDCSWWQATGNVTISGTSTPVIFKTCKNGYLYELNALTGHLYWSWVPPTNIIPRCYECWQLDPTNKTQMTFDFPSALHTFRTQPTTGAQPPFLQYPGAIAGFEDEQSFNPATQTLFVASHIVPSYVFYDGLNSSTYYTSTGEHGTPVNNPAFGGKLSNQNATIWSINAQTGAVNWHYLIPLQGFRGAVTLTGGMVLSTLSSGDMLILDQQTGQLVRDYYVGAPMDVAASVGASAQGTEYILMPVGTCSFVAVITCPGTTPGDIVALSLQNVPAGGGATTSTVTTTQTTTQVSTTTLAGGGAVTTTITKGGSTITTTIAGSTTTVGGGTTTVTASGGGGVDPTVLYGVAAVAVIFIIATGYLAMRGRKPAP